MIFWMGLLVESAYTWYNVFHNNWSTWQEFANNFRQTFGNINDDQQINNRIQKSVQSEKESSTEYIIRISALYNKLQEKVHLKNQIDKIYSSLHSNILAFFDRESVNSYDELIKTVRKYEEKIEIMSQSDKQRAIESKRSINSRGRNNLNAIADPNLEDDLVSELSEINETPQENI